MPVAIGTRNELSDLHSFKPDFAPALDTTASAIRTQQSRTTLSFSLQRPQWLPPLWVHVWLSGVKPLHSEQNLQYSAIFFCKYSMQLIVSTPSLDSLYNQQKAWESGRGLFGCSIGLCKGTLESCLVASEFAPC